MITVTVTLATGVDPAEMTDALNEFFRHPDIHPLIADTDDQGWSYA